VIADPSSLVGAPTRMSALVQLAMLVTDEPWTLDTSHRSRWHAAGLDDESILHAIALAAYFGHLNRIADAVAVPLDYDVVHVPPHADPTTPALARAPAPIASAPALDLATRPATAAALAEWRACVLDRDAPLSRAERLAITGRVADWLGDAADAEPADAPLDPAIAALVETVTLAPWQLADGSFAALRAAGADDARLFDICVVASTAGVISRIRVALAALGRMKLIPLSDI